jgi:hypothetical protein
MGKVHKTWSTETKGDLRDALAMMHEAVVAGVPLNASLTIEGGYGEDKPTLRARWTEKL